MNSTQFAALNQQTLHSLMVNRGKLSEVALHARGFIDTQFNASQYTQHLDQLHLALCQSVGLVGYCVWASVVRMNRDQKLETLLSDNPQQDAQLQAMLNMNSRGLFYELLRFSKDPAEGTGNRLEISDLQRLFNSPALHTYLWDDHLDCLFSELISNADYTARQIISDAETTCDVRSPNWILGSQLYCHPALLKLQEFKAFIESGIDLVTEKLIERIQVQDPFLPALSE